MPTNTKEIYDISVLIQPGMPIYPGDPEVTFSAEQSIAEGALANVTAVCLGTHTGTHIDAPYHVDSSWPPLQYLDLAILLGPVRVVDLDVAQAITAQDLVGLPWEGVERVLFKTRNSQLWKGRFYPDFIYLADDAARFLAQQTKVRLVGIDYLSLDRFDADSLAAHRELLSRGIVVVEGLNLSEVGQGDYELTCLPLKLDSPDAAPVRAILIKAL